MKNDFLIERGRTTLNRSIRDEIKYLVFKIHIMFKQNNYIEKKNVLQGSENRYSKKYVVFMVLKMSLFVMSSVKQK